MRSVSTESRFPLQAVKPLAELGLYRQRCLEATRRAGEGGIVRRQVSPVSGKRLTPWGRISGMDYGRCPETGSLFLVDMPQAERWQALLTEVSRFRQEPEGFHKRLERSRADHVHEPKVRWMEEALRFQGRSRVRLLEVTTGPSQLTPWLAFCPWLEAVETMEESALAGGTPGADGNGGPPVDAAILPESLDRSDHPVRLLTVVGQRMPRGGILFVTGLVASGYDMAVLGAKNLYLYPPDRANCFSLTGLTRILERTGFMPQEISTPGVLDLEIVRAHKQAEPGLTLSGFDRILMDSDLGTRESFQRFLQEQSLSSFARVVAKKL
ncbi:MAG: hypothetical protein HYS41_01605 [Candidatus Omnitrophica bacterium]|nr:hypothetical protein [Candidatus Omnitrophota bacterium]